MAHQIKDDRYWMHKELTQLINGWDLILGCPNDEFDALASKLLRTLQEPHDSEKIERMLESELIVTYGLSPDPSGVKTMADEIENWWTNRAA